MIPRNQNPNQDKNLCSDIEGACLLLSHAAQSGMELKAETAKTITHSKQLMVEGKLTGDDEALFYLAYQELAKLVSPVTVAGLRAAAEISCQTWCRELLHCKPTYMSEAKQAVSWYWRGTITCLIVLLLVQIFWLIGSTAVTAINEAREATIKVTLDIAALKNKAQNKPQGTSPSETDRLTLDKLEIDKKNLRNRTETYYSILRAWNYTWQFKWRSASEILFNRNSPNGGGREEGSDSEASQPPRQFCPHRLAGISFASPVRVAGRLHLCSAHALERDPQLDLYPKITHPVQPEFPRICNE